MLTYAIELPDAVRQEIGDARANEIGAALKDAYAVEQLFAIRNEPEGHDQLAKLDEAAGMLRARANLLRGA